MYENDQSILLGSNLLTNSTCQSPQLWELSTSATVEDADASISAVMDLVSPQGGVAVRLDPHSSHGIVKDLIVLDETQTCLKKKENISSTSFKDEKQACECWAVTPYLSCRLKSLRSDLPRSCCAWSLDCFPFC